VSTVVHVSFLHVYRVRKPYLKMKNISNPERLYSLFKLWKKKIYQDYKLELKVQRNKNNKNLVIQ